MASRAHTAGFTYVEVLLAAALLAMTTATIGYALGHARDLGDQQAVAAQGRYLLHDGLAWLQTLPREDAKEPGGFGMEADESALADVDDVDDLAGIVETGPVDRLGNVAEADWTRTWTVSSANLTTPTTDAARGSTPLLRVSLVVHCRGREITRETLLLSRTP
ncbi:MAG: hypothetical protein JNL08_18265 [Planctomycetes bacterium]|nr:hypothetical protein [Planctomycetota bacterium]